MNQREIMKFRAWDGLSKKMSFWTMNDLCNHTNDSSEKPSCLEEWMLYTGLKDKNGKEIYEGDVIKSSYLGGTIEKIVWEDGGFKVQRKGYWERLHSLLVENSEIIGNVFENPRIPRH